ncbi:DUF378 domain-containing protein [Alicyclobacillus dauci]|uniref:DUF378 domain-containing protein n=1 Tax=Alicyclobacillus dauci TaxID=1475485 RepID=A0ABY6Z139_9BACL|nr:DUF378 domain-containing protein [Alicyclobacillus dauci]WAH36397.1 DUF378 domain-containing protein [Alicyclobacillus dauci]
MRWNTIDWVAWVLAIVGALNWGVIGFFGFNVIDAVFGTGTGLSRTIYALVGLGGLWQLISVLSRSGTRH